MGLAILPAVHGVDAIEQISRNCFRSFATLPNAQLIDDGTRFGVLSHAPSSFFNGIAASSFDGSDAEEQVALTIDFFRAHQCPFRWWVTPSTRPRELATVLQAQGMRHAYDSPGMAAELSSLPLDVAPPDDVTIRRIGDVRELEHWLDVFVPVFSLPPDGREIWRGVYAQFPFDDEAAWTHFVGFADERPMSTTSVLIDGELAGIYNVATLPEARGRGVGSSVTRAAMRYARDRGATTAALQSSTMGLGVYRALGFVEHCDLSLYDWKPEYE
jgi:GNAT superfamily N-acetyltransferase